ncbi:MAG: transglycosylase SLT domain-containing protein, partial [Candidatus Eremiobacteraeota bacterium]|nr:transglycosylase SLT domain-containing protein [Candidatus Eremiobacteraeota bacterium]
MCLTLLCGCANQTSETYDRKPVKVAQIDTLMNAALSWHIPVSSENIRGLRLLRDGRPFAHRNLAVARSILRTNMRIGPFDALQLSDFAIERADHYGLNPEFLCATLLQESAFDPDALSNAGAVGLGQFTLETASAYHVDPFDARDAIRGSALLLAAYVSLYRGVYG